VDPVTPLVSVIIPTYNCVFYLSEAIDSVLSQTQTNFEIIIVDDGSTDGTRETVKQYESKAAITYIYQQNRGLPAARNRAVEVAQGKYVAALDADDMLDPRALEEMTRALQESGANWCLIDVTKFWDGRGERQNTALPPDDLLHGILWDDFIRRAMFFRKDALIRANLWDPEMKNREDWDLNIRLIENGEPFVYVPKPLYCYRKRPDSITTGNPEKMLFYTAHLLRKHHKRLADAGDRLAARIYADNMWKLARRYFYELGDLRQLVKCVGESLAYDLAVSRLVHPLAHRFRPRPRLASNT
jgi:glycosyltransferase involved in cell wall biosynthesis